MLEDKLPELEFVTGSVIRVLPADPSSSAFVAPDDPGEDRRHSGGGAGAVLALSSSSSSAEDGSGGGGGGDPVRAAQAVLDAMLSEVPGRKEDVYVVLDQDAHGYASCIKNVPRKSYKNSSVFFFHSSVLTGDGGPASVFDINMRTRAELKVLQPREAPFEGLQSRVLPTDRVARIRGTKDQVQRIVSLH